jgi:hypothetical protein
MLHVIPAANRLLDGIDPEATEAARGALAESQSLLEAVTRAGLLDQLEKSVIEDTRSFFAALPVSVDVAMRAVISGALERGLPVVIQWKPGPTAEVRAWETVEGNVGQVCILLITPH